jgi:AcrR family transcriptional regulator
MTRKRSTTRARRAADTLVPARSGRRRSPTRTAAPSEDTPYHHGALRDALLKAAERVLERDGLAGLTLRAVAREAGVSHAAPTHHFGDLTGLVSELAAIGFRQFNTAMAAAGASATVPLEKALARA